MKETIENSQGVLKPLGNNTMPEIERPEEQQNRKKQHESDEKYRTFFENIPAGFFQSTPDGTFLRINSTHAKIFGYNSPEEMISNITSIDRQLYKNPRERERFRQLLEKRGIVENFEAEFYQKDGNSIWVSLSAHAVSDSNGIVTHYEGIARDITSAREPVNTPEISQKHFRQFADSLPQTVCEYDKDGNFAFVSSNGYTMFGYETDNPAIITSIFQLIMPDDHERLKENMVRIFTGGIRDHIDQYRGIKKDGNTFPITVYTTLFFYGKEQTGARSIIIDFTEYKRVEKSLQESEEKYRSIFECSLVGVFQCTPEGHIMNVNPAFAKIYGFDSPDELLADTEYGNIALYTDSPSGCVFLNLIKEQGIIECFEAQKQRRDGTTIWNSFNARAIFGTDGKIIRIEGTVEDATRRKQIESALFESETKYRSVAENSLVGFYIIQDNIFCYVNNRFCEITGYEYNEIVGRIDPISVIHPDDRETAQEYFTGCLQEGAGPSKYEFTGKGIRKDGSIVAIKTMGNTVTYNGKTAIFGSILDISKEHGLESQLRQAQKMEAIGVLAGGIAHDFNNLLTIINGYCNILKMDLDKDNPLLLNVNQILAASRKGANMIKDLLAFSRKQPVSLIPTNINAHIKKTEALLKRLISEAIRLEVSFSNDNIVAMADSNQIDQILFNLTTNARDAMPSGGTIHISTKLVVLDSEFISVHGFGEKGAFILISFTDNGKGMDKPTLEKIFDPFFTTKNKGKGTGLGLATVYGIVKQHNGFITVQSKLKEGTTFLIYLPAIESEIEKKQPSRRSVKGGEETILVITDDEETQGFIGKMLQLYGYTVIEIADGTEAIDILQTSNQTDCVILDSPMQKNNSKEVYREIVKIKPHVKILFISGYTRDIIFEKEIEENGGALIFKPLASDDLMQAVRELFDNR